MCERDGLPQHGFSRIAIEYEKPILNVSTFDHDSGQFVHCLSADIQLDYEGFFAITGRTGSLFPMHAYANSFELYDPQRIDISHRF